MPRYSEDTSLPYSLKTLHDIVMDIEAYPEFVPWIEAARITSQQSDTLLADLVVKYNVIQKTYTSKVSFAELLPDADEAKITVTLEKGPFNYLHVVWHFRRLSDQETRIIIAIDFELTAHIMEQILQTIFDQAVPKIVRAFRERANDKT